jgi:hypothetical protein
MWWDRQRPWIIFVPPVTAAAFMVGFFWLFDRWDNLENPVASQLAPLAGVIGFVTAIALSRIRQWELIAIPGAIAAGLALWAIFAPHETPEDKDFQQILWILTALALTSTLVLNLPQIVRGRYAQPPSDSEDEG